MKRISLARASFILGFGAFVTLNVPAARASETTRTAPRCDSGLAAQVVVAYPITSGARQMEHIFGDFPSRPWFIMPTKESGIFAPIAYKYFDPYRSRYEDGFGYTGDFAALVQSIRVRMGEHPVIIVPGGEHAVEIVQQLHDALDFPMRNDAAQLLARVDKYEMAMALKAAKLNYVRGQVGEDADTLVAWARDTHRQWPVFVKPAQGCASQGGTVCANEKQIREHFASIHGMTSVLGKVVKRVVVQELLDVRENEFVVDGISRNGVHKIYVVGKYSRRDAEFGGNFVLKGGELLDPEDPRLADIMDYAPKALNAIGWKWGPFHMEIVRTRRGPALDDFGGRFAGTWPSLGFLGTGHNYAQWFRMSYLDAEGFGQLPAVARLRQPARFIAIEVPRDGMQATKKTADEVTAELRTKYGITSLHSYQPQAAPGARVNRSRDLLTLFALLEMSNPDRRKLDADDRKIRELDAAGYFVGPATN